LHSLFASCAATIDYGGSSASRKQIVAASHEKRKTAREGSRLGSNQPTIRSYSIHLILLSERRRTWPIT
jgi:hypothetical protein